MAGPLTVRVVTNAFRLLVRSGLLVGRDAIVVLEGGHKRLSAVGPIRTRRAHCGTLPRGLGHKRLSAVGPIRTSLTWCRHVRRASTSQTPFGCWSDQDTQQSRPRRSTRAVVTNAFRLLVRSGRGAVTPLMTVAAASSQTPFGCWSDQDRACGCAHAEAVTCVTNAFRLLVRSGLADSGLQVPLGETEVTNAFRLLVRSGP